MGFFRVTDKIFMVHQRDMAKPMHSVKRRYHPTVIGLRLAPRCSPHVVDISDPDRGYPGLPQALVGAAGFEPATPAV